MTDELLRDLAKDLPYERPSEARRDALRSSLLVEATESTGARTTAPRRWPIVGAFVAGALAAAAIAVIVVRQPTPAIERANLAQVTASSPEVRLDHQIVATETGSDEIVRVREGTVALAVPAQRRGDRLVVRTTTAEVEGDAGELEVVVAHDQLQAVHVKSGIARVIVIGQAPVVLAAGQTWRTSVVTADLSPAPNPSTPTSDPATTTPAPPRSTATAADTPPAPLPDTVAPVPATTTRPPATPPIATSAVAPPSTTIARAPAPPAPITSSVTPPAAVVDATTTPVPPVGEPPSIEQRFQRGWSLLRAGKAQQAADELGAAADAAPDVPLAADARYFQAVALVRANDPRAAERVLVQFLDRSPRSLRRGRAAVLLGRLIAERGDAAGARAWLETAASDPDPAVAAAAKAGLQTLPRP